MTFWSGFVSLFNPIERADEAEYPYPFVIRRFRFVGDLIDVFPTKLPAMNHPLSKLEMIFERASVGRVGDEGWLSSSITLTTITALPKGS
jgi:hypothetical protein